MVKIDKETWTSLIENKEKLERARYAIRMIETTYSMLLIYKDEPDMVKKYWKKLVGFFDDLKKCLE